MQTEKRSDGENWLPQHCLERAPLFLCPACLSMLLIASFLCFLVRQCRLLDAAMLADLLLALSTFEICNPETAFALGVCNVGQNIMICDFRLASVECMRATALR